MKKSRERHTQNKNAQQPRKQMIKNEIQHKTRTKDKRWKKVKQ